jgi:hypothetical protein
MILVVALFILHGLFVLLSICMASVCQAHACTDSLTNFLHAHSFTVHDYSLQPPKCITTVHIHASISEFKNEVACIETLHACIPHEAFPR